MKSEFHILVALVANMLLAIIELVGGFFVGSIALISDSLHSLGDSATIAISFFLELKSKNPADKRHSFGYARYSMLGGLLTNMFLITGAFTIVIHAINGLFNPQREVASGAMILLALVGAGANLIAAIATHKGHSHNEKAVSLHAVQDVLTHLALILGAFIIKHTGFVQIDAILSILIALFIFCHALHHMRESLDVFLDNTPRDLNIDALEQELSQLPNLIEAHHIHIWSLDGTHNCATLHVVARQDTTKLREAIRKLFKKYKITHVTIEIEDNCDCKYKNCKLRDCYKES